MRTELDTPIEVMGFGSVRRNKLHRLSEEKLRLLTACVTAVTAQIKGQLDRADAERSAGGERSDPRWFAKAKSALRLYAHLYQLICIENSRRRSERRTFLSYQHAFVEQARQMLNEATFNQIATAAKQSVAAAEKAALIEAAS